MLTYKQRCVLFPHLMADQLNNNVKKTSPRRRLFGCCSDPQETRRLLEEQFLADRERMIRKYNFDILTSRFVTCSVDNIENLGTDSEGLDLNPASVSAVVEPVAEVEDSEADVRHRPGRHSPYTRQTRVTDYWRTKKSTTESKRATSTMAENVKKL